MPKKEKPVGFWPFDNYKDGVRRHWEWLRRWLLANVRAGAAFLVIIFIAVALIATTDNWLPLLKDLPRKYIQPATSLETGKIDPVKVELTPTEVITRRFETTVREDVFGEPGKAAMTPPEATAFPAGNDDKLSTGKNDQRNDTTGKAKDAVPGKSTGGATDKPFTNGGDPDKFGKPMEGELAVPYGLAYSPVYQDYRFHDGIDILSTKDDRVKAVLDGTVTGISKDDTEGLVIIIDHAKAYRSVYGHIGNPEVRVGQQVKKGQIIGRVEAEKGILHFAIQKGQQGLNPLQYLSY